MLAPNRRRPIVRAHIPRMAIGDSSVTAGELEGRAALRRSRDHAHHDERLARHGGRPQRRWANPPAVSAPAIPRTNHAAVDYVAGPGLTVLFGTSAGIETLAQLAAVNGAAAARIAARTFLTQSSPGARSPPRDNVWAGDKDMPPAEYQKMFKNRT